MGGRCSHGECRAAVRLFMVCMSLTCASDQPGAINGRATNGGSGRHNRAKDIITFIQGMNGMNGMNGDPMNDGPYGMNGMNEGDRMREW
jgi:hypothetical protein